MGNGTQVAEYWLAEHKDAIIHCPYQPGQLKILKNACIKRYLASQKDKSINPMTGQSFFQYTVKNGLSLCKECPIGKSLAGI